MSQSFIWAMPGGVRNLGTPNSAAQHPTFWNVTNRTEVIVSIPVESVQLSTGRGRIILVGPGVHARPEPRISKDMLFVFSSSRMFSAEIS